VLNLYLMWSRRIRKGKNSKSSNLSKIDIITKSTSQYLQRRKWFVKQSYGSKDICGQIFGQPSLVSRDESAFVLLTSTSVHMMSVPVHGTWHNHRSTRFMMMSTWWCGNTRGCHMSLIFGLFLSIHGLMEKCHVVVCTTMWHPYNHLTSEMEIWTRRSDVEMTMHRGHMSQWMVTMWPSHGLPRGSRKMPNEGP
jgi:hypothetical protein